MKKSMQQILMFLLMVGVLSSAKIVFAEERQEEMSKELGAYQPERHETTVLLEDVSPSMKTVFSKEVSEIKINRDEFSLYRPFASEGKTDLYGELNKAFQEADSVSIITDLWDTTQEELNDWKGKDLRIYVPFNAQDEEDVKHVENVVYQSIQPHFLDSFVKVVYLDEVEVIMLQSESAIIRDKMKMEEEQEENEQESKIEENNNEIELMEEPIEEKIELTDMSVEPEILSEASPESSPTIQPTYDWSRFFQENWKKIILIFFVIFGILVTVTKCKNVILEMLQCLADKLDSVNNKIFLVFKKPIVQKVWRIIKRIVIVTVQMIITAWIIFEAIKNKERINPDLVITIIAFILLVVAAGMIFLLRDYLKWNWEDNKICSLLITLLVTAILTGIVVFFWVNEPAMRFLLLVIGELMLALVLFIVVSFRDKIHSRRRRIIRNTIFEVFEWIAMLFNEGVAMMENTLENHKKIKQIFRDCEILLCVNPLKGFSVHLKRNINKSFQKKNVVRFSTLEEVRAILEQMNAEKQKNVVLILGEDMKNGINVQNYENIQSLTVISPPNQLQNF